jgi:hypothetical protein
MYGCASHTWPRGVCGRRGTSACVHTGRRRRRRRAWLAMASPATGLWKQREAAGNLRVSATRHGQRRARRRHSAHTRACAACGSARWRSGGAPRAAQAVPSISRISGEALRAEPAGAARAAAGVHASNARRGACVGDARARPAAPKRRAVPGETAGGRADRCVARRRRPTRRTRKRCLRCVQMLLWRCGGEVSLAILPVQLGFVAFWALFAVFWAHHRAGSAATHPTHDARRRKDANSRHQQPFAAVCRHGASQRRCSQPRSLGTRVCALTDAWGGRARGESAPATPRSDTTTPGSVWAPFCCHLLGARTRSRSILTPHTLRPLPAGCVSRPSAH